MPNRAEVYFCCMELQAQGTTKPKRYFEIDLMRFIAALSVVLFHVTYFGPHMHNLSPVQYPVLGKVFKYGYLGVELFFIISGYVVLMSAQGKTVSQFFVSRVMRLYPAYWVAVTLTFVVVRLWGPAMHTVGWSSMLDAPLAHYLYNLTMFQSFLGVVDLDGVYWTLAIELIFYFWIAVGIAFGWLKHLVPVLIVWLAYCALAAYQPVSAPFAWALFPQWAPFFISGMVLYLLQTKQAPTWKLVLLLAASYPLSLRCALASLAHTEETFRRPFSSTVVLVTVTLFFVVMLLIIYRQINLGQSAWLARAGTITYPIYLIHHNIGFVILQRLGPKVDKYLLLAGLLFTLCLVGYALHVLVERRYSKQLGNLVMRAIASF
jgi:peptidoglycan/LPS O-acetylase OafA/YrhL